MAIDGSMNIVQVQHQWYTTVYYNAGASSMTNITNFAKDIQMKFTGGKVLVHIQFTGLLNCDGSLTFKRDGTVQENNFLGTERQHANSSSNSSNHHDSATYSGFFLDNPNSSSGTWHTYQVCARATGCGNDVYINRSPGNSSQNGRSSITLFEVSP
tara:strand:+ start:314 stop:781 length:468 start_codon:yes stop_codon:yes gene_type:complete